MQDQDVNCFVNVLRVKRIHLSHRAPVMMTQHFNPRELTSNGM